MTSNDKVLERDRPIDLERNLKHVLSDPSCDALNSGLYVGQGVHGDPPTHRWCTLIERYVRGEIACYITLGERVSEASANNLAAIEHGVLLYWPGLHFLQLFDPLKRLKEWWHTELELMYKRAYNADRAVLVGVRQFMQMPQGAFPILPCGIGLFRPDEFNGVLSNTFQKLVDATNIESFLALENGELVFCRKYWRSPRGQNDKFPDDVIERRTKVVDYFSDPNAPHWIGGLFDVNAEGNNAGIDIEIERGSIRVRKGLDESNNLFIKSLDLIQCTREFQSHT